MASNALLFPGGLLTSVEALVSGQALESRLPMFSSMDASGSLLVLKSRVPGPIKTAYVVVVSTAHNTARIVSSARIPGWNRVWFPFRAAVAVAVGEGFAPDGIGPCVLPGELPSGPPVTATAIDRPGVVKIFKERIITAKFHHVDGMSLFFACRSDSPHFREGARLSGSSQF